MILQALTTVPDWFPLLIAGMSALAVLDCAWNRAWRSAPPFIGFGAIFGLIAFFHWIG